MLPNSEMRKRKKDEVEKHRGSSERGLLVFVFSSFLAVSSKCLVPGHAAWNRCDGKTSQAEKVKWEKTGRSGRQREMRHEN